MTKSMKMSKRSVKKVQRKTTAFIVFRGMCITGLSQFHFANRTFIWRSLARASTHPSVYRTSIGGGHGQALRGERLSVVGGRPIGRPEAYRMPPGRDTCSAMPDWESCHRQRALIADAIVHAIAGSALQWVNSRRRPQYNHHHPFSLSLSLRSHQSRQTSLTDIKHANSQ